MSEPLEDLYFNWLCTKVMYDEPSRTYDLMRILHSFEFFWTVEGDDNRAEDGKDLRYRFAIELGVSDYSSLNLVGCSVLEMLIAFADRAEYQTDIEPKKWFWTMLENLGLNEYRRVTETDIPKINQALHIFVWRLYDDRGIGGLWPLNHQPAEDQRGVNIWYQFFAYLEDRGLV